MAIPLSLSEVPNATPYIQYVATAGQTVFPYPFPITQDSDLIVVVNGVTSATDSGYTLSGQGNATGGNVTFTTGQSVGALVTLYRDIAIERLTQIGQNSGFSSSAFNAEFNNLYLICQQLEASLAQCLQVPNTNNPAPTTSLLPGAYASKYLSFDANGNPTPAQLTSSGSLTKSIISGLLYPQTTAEDAVNVTPVNEYVPDHTAVGEVYAARYGVVGDNTTVCTAGLTNAFKVAQQVGCGVVLPAGGIITSNLQFGTQATGAQSTSPLYLRGTAGIGTVLRAQVGTTGTLLQAWTIGGVVFRDFGVDCNSAAATAIDTTWKAGTGPSVQNRYSNVWVQGFTTSGWVAWNNNDCIFDSCVARNAASSGLVAFDITAGGGAVDIVNCFWPGGVLDVCCQNAYITGGFGYGIRLNRNSTSFNILALDGVQLYSSSIGNSCIFDYSPSASGHQTYGITCRGVQFNLNASGDSVFNIALSGAVTLDCCNVTQNSGPVFGSATVNKSGTGNSYAIFRNFGLSACTLPVIAGIKYLNELENTGTQTVSDLEGQTYTPTWTGSSVNPALGNGTLTGRYFKYGNRCKVEIALSIGSTTTLGTGEWFFSLPFTTDSLAGTNGMAVAVHSGSYYTLASQCGTSVAKCYALSNASSSPVGAAAPFAWASGDTLTITLDYITA